MGMQAESLDVLENAALPPAQARAIVRAIEIELAGARDVLATKHDIVLLRAEMVEMCANLKSELKADIGNLRGELKADIGNVRGELTSEISGLRAELKAEISGLRGELKAGISGLGGELRAEFHAGASSITRQMYTAMLGQMAVLLGLAYFFVTRLAA